MFSPPAPRFQPAELGFFSSSPSCCQILPLGTPTPHPAGPAPRPGAHTRLVRPCSPPAHAACSRDTRSRAALTRPLGALLSDLIPAPLPSSSLGEQGYPKCFPPPPPSLRPALTCERDPGGRGERLVCKGTADLDPALRGCARSGHPRIQHAPLTGSGAASPGARFPPGGGKKKGGNGLKRDLDNTKWHLTGCHLQNKSERIDRAAPRTWGRENHRRVGLEGTSGDLRVRPPCQNSSPEQAAGDQHLGSFSSSPQGV